MLYHHTMFGYKSLSGSEDTLKFWMFATTLNTVIKLLLDTLAYDALPLVAKEYLIQKIQ